MNQLTTIAALPGSGGGCMSALPAEVNKAKEWPTREAMISMVNAYFAKYMPEAVPEEITFPKIVFLGEEPAE